MSDSYFPMLQEDLDNLCEYEHGDLQRIVKSFHAEIERLRAERGGRWTAEKPTKPGLYWWRWGDEKHDANYVEGGEIVRVWIQPEAHVAGTWWVSHFDEAATKVELEFTGGEWWSVPIEVPPLQGGAG